MYHLCMDSSEQINIGPDSSSYGYDACVHHLD